MNAAAPRNGRRTTQLTRTDWPRPVSVTAGSQRLERAGWNGPVPLLSLLAAGSNALAPHGRGKGRDMPRRRTTLTPAGGGTGSSNPFPSGGESANHRFRGGERLEPRRGGRQRAGIPGIPIGFDLSPYPAHRILADRAAKDGGQRPAHPTAVGAGKIGARDQRIGMPGSPLVGAQRSSIMPATAPQRRLVARWESQAPMRRRNATATVVAAIAAIQSTSNEPSPLSGAIPNSFSMKSMAVSFDQRGGIDGSPRGQVTIGHAEHAADVKRSPRQSAALAVSELVAIGALRDAAAIAQSRRHTRLPPAPPRLYSAERRNLARGALFRALRGAGSSSSSFPAMGWPGCLPGSVFRSAAHP